MYRNQTGSPSAASRQGWKASASLVTGASGTVVGEQRYYPFGETRGATGSMLTDKLFTGQREMEGLGIYHYGARFYSPTLGRFLSANTIVPGYANPQNLNRYSYVLNNPLRYTDPTGHNPIPLVLIVVDILLVAGVATLAYVMWNPDTHDAMAENITNAMDEIFQRRNSGQKNIDAIEANRGKTADSQPPLLPNFSPKPKESCGIICKAILGGILLEAACVSIFGEECTKAASNPHSEKPPTSTPTITSTSTPGCPPPYAQCPTQTSTSAPTLTSTPTHTSTPSYTAPYQNSPWYSHPGVDEE